MRASFISLGSRPLWAALFALSVVGCGASVGEAIDGGSVGEPDASLPADADTSTPTCGDGQRSGAEDCDDGNDVNGDGCTASCTLESDFACPTPGDDCVQVVICGNGRIEGSETCDDRDTEAGDGCDEDCQVEPGWSCPVAGAACSAASCGDGHVAGFEQCDDGDDQPGDGCDADCKLEEGYHCPAAGAECEATVCGDGLVQGTEECDDQNQAVGDGCTPLCTSEPQCSDGTCDAVCGDGVRWDPEECDDGNEQSGDGCSADCEVEAGFTCDEVPLPDPPEVAIPITVRDFVASCDVEAGDARLADFEAGAVAPFGHPDFECYNNSLRLGMVEDTLDADGKPAWIASDSTYDEASFSRWYRSDPDYNRTSAQALTLPSIGGGAYQIDSGAFYPADGVGFDVEDCGGAPCESLHDDGAGTGDRNFHFTTEVRYWFEYGGTEELAFSGDDDVWVFINGRLAVDLGGVHDRRDGSVDLSDPAVASALELTPGGIYEVVVFHAERHTTRSQYRLTLTNFNQAPSTCADVCGDGVASSQEVCDDGADNGEGDGSPYGGCAADCTREPYCGDAVVDDDHGEVCDDGLNLGGDASSCAPGCQSLGSSCGDGVVQTSSGEQCDDGNTDSGDGCNGECLIEID